MKEKHFRVFQKLKESNMSQPPEPPRVQAFVLDFPFVTWNWDLLWVLQARCKLYLPYNCLII